MDDYFEEYKQKYNQNNLGDSIYAPISQDLEDHPVNFQSKFSSIKTSEPNQTEIQ